MGFYSTNFLMFYLKKKMFDDVSNKKLELLILIILFV